LISLEEKKSVVDVISPDNFNSALDLVMEKMGGFSSSSSSSACQSSMRM
jgi:hypothetical protein